MVPAATWSRLTRSMLMAAALCALLGYGAAPAALAQQAAPTTVYVPQTGHTADLLFLDAWRGAPEMIGDPITEEFPARAGFTASSSDGQIVQFFQNVALLWSPDAPPEAQLAPLPLGERALDRLFERNPGMTRLGIVGRTACPHDSAGSCRGFVGTGQTLRGDFLAYWEGNGGETWLGAPISEAFRAPDRSAVQYFEGGALRKSAQGIVAPLPIASMLARDLGLDTAPLPQPDGVPVYDESLFILPAPAPLADPAAATAAPALPADWVQPQVQVGWVTGTFGPGPQVGAGKEIVVSISQQSMWAYENGQLIASTYVSTGTAEIPETVTPLGRHIVLSKYEMQTMQGVIGGEEYMVPDVPNVMYFDDLGNALHGAYWHNGFGVPRSHGCVNLPLDMAAWLYQWTPIATPVTVVP